MLVKIAVHRLADTPADVWTAGSVGHSGHALPRWIEMESHAAILHSFNNPNASS
jgi:hypothetical protein